MAVKARSDIATLEQALEMFRLDQGAYPSAAQGLAALRVAPAGLAQPETYRQGGYIKDLPMDPWGRAYLYRVPGEGARLMRCCRWGPMASRGNGARCRYWLGPHGAPSVGGTERSWPGWPCFWGRMGPWRRGVLWMAGRRGSIWPTWRMFRGALSRWCRPMRCRCGLCEGLRGRRRCRPWRRRGCRRKSGPRGMGWSRPFWTKRGSWWRRRGQGRWRAGRGRCARRWGARPMRWCLPG
jgi:type II secretion system protein G